MAKQIYIVEDDEDIRFIVGYILSDMGYEINLSETIADFKAQLNNNGQPGLILLDVMLPDGNGLELCLQLKNDPATSRIPIIIMSAHAAEDDVLKMACAEDFISKPFDLDHLAATVKKYLPI
ncbi:MAG TPA: response regulator [Pedobacter sp.]